MMYTGYAGYTIIASRLEGVAKDPAWYLELVDRRRRSTLRLDRFHVRTMLIYFLDFQRLKSFHVID